MNREMLEAQRQGNGQPAFTLQGAWRSGLDALHILQGSSKAWSSQAATQGAQGDTLGWRPRLQHQLVQDPAHASKRYTAAACFCCVPATSGQHGNAKLFPNVVRPCGLQTLQTPLRHRTYLESLNTGITGLCLLQLGHQDWSGDNGPVIVLGILWTTCFLL